MERTSSNCVVRCPTMYIKDRKLKKLKKNTVVILTLKFTHHSIFLALLGHNQLSIILTRKEIAAYAVDKSKQKQTFLKNPSRPHNI